LRGTEDAESLILVAAKGRAVLLISGERPNPIIDVLSVSLSQDGGQWRREAGKEFAVAEGLSGITNLGTLAGLIDVGEAGYRVNNPDSPRARREVLLRLEHKIVRVVPGRGNFDGEVRRAFQTLSGIDSYEPIGADESDIRNCDHFFASAGKSHCEM
jgi:hypothetical protein